MKAPRNNQNAFSLPELHVVLVIIGILVLVTLPNLMPLISRAKATEAQQLTFLHSLEQSYFYTYSRYSDDLSELGFEQAQLVTEGGNANYRIEVISADMAKDTSFLPYAYRRTERFNVTTNIPQNPYVIIVRNNRVPASNNFIVLLFNGHEWAIVKR